MGGPEHPRPKSEPEQQKKKPEHPLRSSSFRGVYRFHEAGIRGAEPHLSEDEIKQRVKEDLSKPMVLETLTGFFKDLRKITKLENKLRKEKAKGKRMHGH